MRRALICLAASLIVPVLLSAAPARYTLTVSGGSGSGAYYPGGRIRIAAHPINPPAHFHHWSGDVQTVEDASRPATIVVMPDHALKIQANYVEPHRFHVPEDSPR